ncbi:MAG: phosphoribosylanthranilate isomerase [Ilumatobacteraceae bacterium]|jgi:phosphoribosylanthranilate isomerase|nr:N-(5'-phosphoribosyl)anthranilate isomerase [Actinomycetes bacterium]
MLVKICGITNEEDALLSVAMGATALGFIFAPSKRQVTVGKVADIVKRLPPGVLTVGVFRDHDPKTVVRIVREAGLRGAQLHGRETVSMVDDITADVGWVMKAVVAGSPEAEKCDRYRTDVVLFDSPTPGSGETYDWGLLTNIPKGVRCVVSGGLTPDNVADAIATVRPYGVDVCSGVEREAGRKDATKLRRFVQSSLAAFDALVQ